MKQLTEKEKAKEIYYKIYTWGINKEGQSLSEKECKELTAMVVDELIDIADYPVYDEKVWEELTDCGLAQLEIESSEQYFYKRVKEEISNIN